jgi:Fic family protein
VETFRAIVELKAELDEKTQSLGRRAHNGARLLQVLYSTPGIRSQDVSRRLDVSPMTAHNLIRDFEALGILREVTGFQRNRIYFFERYFNLFNK